MIASSADPMEPPKGHVKATTLEYRILDCVRMFPGWIPTPDRFHELPEHEQEELLTYQAAKTYIDGSRLQALTTALMASRVI